MPRLTKSVVDRIEPPARKPDGQHVQVFYRDDTLLGFGLRVYSGGSKTFIVETRIHGKVKRISLGRYGALTCEEARKQAKNLLGDIAIGNDPIAEKREKIAQEVTLKEAFENYLLARKNLKATTIHDYRRGIEGALSDWQNKRLTDLSKDMIETRHRELGSKSHARANNTMRVLRAVFNFAKDKYEDTQGSSLFQTNPVDRLSRSRGWYNIERRRTLIMPHELKPWYDATMQLNRESTRDYLHLLLFTGLRRTEAARLRWEQIDLIDRSLHIKDTKNREPHTLPLSSYLYELLSDRHQANTGQSPWVFPSVLNDGPLVDPKTSMARVTEISGVSFTLHDLRRTFITIAESLDIPAYALKRLLNHKSSNDVTAGYIVPSTDRLRVPMQRITDYIMEQVKDKTNEL